MIHAKFRNHRTISSVEEGFDHIWAWRPSWSCDMHHLKKVLSHLPKEAQHEIVR